MQTFLSIGLYPLLAVAFLIGVRGLILMARDIEARKVQGECMGKDIYCGLAATSEIGIPFICASSR